MTNATARTALAYARRGWPVFPCQPGQKIPATPHGYLDATTDSRQIEAWFGRRPDYNLAVATGAPGPDVLDVDQHGDAGNGFAAFYRLRESGLADGAAAYVRTPAGGIHAYFAGSDQRSGRLPAHHLDFRSQGGYVLAPHSQIGGHRYELIKKLTGRDGLDWAAAVRRLEPEHQIERPDQRPAPSPDLSHLGRQPASRQPQLRTVLGRQPRPGHRHRRRPQPASRRRPPGRPRRPRDRPHPRLRPQNPPGPAPARGGGLT